MLVVQMKKMTIDPVDLVQALRTLNLPSLVGQYINFFLRNVTSACNIKKVLGNKDTYTMMCRSIICREGSLYQIGRFQWFPNLLQSFLYPATVEQLSLTVTFPHCLHSNRGRVSVGGQKPQLKPCVHLVHSHPLCVEWEDSCTSLVLYAQHSKHNPPLSQF